MIYILLYTAFIICCGVFTYYSVKYANPYKLLMIFGGKGSGKSTLLTKLSIKHRRKGWTVYSTVPVPGAYLINPEDVGHVYMPPKSCILIDEVGTIWHNRNYANFDKDLIKYFKLQRHYRHKIYLFSQAWDVDKTIRLVCDFLYIVENYFNCLSIARRIKRKLMVVEPTGESESRIADCLILQPLFLAMFGTAIFTWIPHYAKYFDSFVCEEMPDKKAFEYKELPSRKEEFVAKLVHFNVIKRKAHKNKRGRSRRKKRRTCA